MRRYETNTGDASILLEGKTAGLGSVVTLDSDFGRFTQDFDVYTWL